MFGVWDLSLGYLGLRGPGKAGLSELTAWGFGVWDLNLGFSACLIWRNLL